MNRKRKGWVGGTSKGSRKFRPPSPPFPHPPATHLKIHVIFFSFVSRLGMYRDAERQLKSALRDQDMVDIYLYLCKVYRRLDQPLTAVDVYKKVGLLLFSFLESLFISHFLQCPPHPPLVGRPPGIRICEMPHSINNN